MPPTRVIRTFSILGADGAGKTALAEALLRLADAKKASPEGSTSRLDAEPEEKKRNFTLSLHPQSFEEGGRSFHVLDCPGFAAFLTEVEWALQVTDGAVLAVSAADGAHNRAERTYDVLADGHPELRVGRQEDVHAGSEFHQADAFAAPEDVSLAHAAHDSAGQDPDDLPDDHPTSTVIDPDLVQLVVAGGLAVCGQEPAGAVLDARDVAIHRRAVHVYVERRQEDRDLRPVAGRRPPAVARPRDHHLPVGRRHDEPGIGGNASLRVAEEEREEPPERGERRGERVAARGDADGRRDERPRDEGIAGAVDLHRRTGSNALKASKRRASDRGSRLLALWEMSTKDLNRAPRGPRAAGRTRRCFAAVVVGSASIRLGLLGGRSVRLAPRQREPARPGL